MTQPDVATIGATRHHGLDAWALENAALRVVVQPAPGGKLVSLYDKRHHVEWLAPVLQPPAAELPYAGGWSGPASYGWDEMMPTIIACPYPGPGPFVGVDLPDHGEVWTLPWHGRAAHGGVTVSVEGRALPYHFERTLRLAAPATVVLDYTVLNLGELPLLYLWAAHPLFVAEAGAEIVLPPEVDTVVSVLPQEWGPQWGPPGTLNPWPSKQVDGVRHDLHRLGDIDQHAGRKFYVPPEQRIRWAGIYRPAVNAGLQMRWQPEEVPYFGVWVDEGSVYPAAGNIALEPATGYYDSLALAAGQGRTCVLAPGAGHRWQISVEVGAGRPPFTDRRSAAG